ncbi:MAG: DNA mismatch repair protein MutS, partial [Armatimonadetes bacterium]|nr:DNA mismatch repair protein MutS [Armatimonadota bacterium]
MLLLEKEHFNLNLEDTTPMLKQYFEIKSSYPDCILFYRVGDFYETYAQDAEISSKILDIVLTSRDAGRGKKIFMAGVPYHAASQYIYNLVQNGCKVAICEQMENPKLVKGIVKREVVRVIT